MESSLLATKLRIPPEPSHLLRRPRLVDALERNVLATKLVLISAPAGYGKSTLVSQWARSSRCPVAWLSLDEGDNEPERFFRYLLAAWNPIEPGVVESRVGMILGAIAPVIDDVVSAFINLADTLPDHTVLVLDDYHLIVEPPIHQALTFLLDRLPPKLHVVIVGRGDPPLPLARYRARQELVELHAEELRFGPDETEEFLNSLTGLDLAHSEIAAIHAQLEGWVAGLQLMSLSLRGGREAAGTVRVSGRQRYIADYLSDDVLAHVSDDVRQFLLQTSILDRLCGSLCDAVTGRDDSQEMLEILERENLFLIPLDDHRAYFRYHRLFADFLGKELYRAHPDQVANLHRHAAGWYVAHDMPEPAFRHALAGDDAALVVRIVERYVTVKLFGGETSVVKRWLDSIPAAWYAIHPDLGLAQAGHLLLTGQVDTCDRCLTEVEQRVLSDRTDMRVPLARLTAMRCFVACFRNDLAQAETFADRALQDLPSADVSYRADIYHALGETYRGNGRWREAGEHYRKVLLAGHDPASSLRSAHVFGALADLELRQGHLHSAASYWRRALAAVQERENWGHLPLPVIGWVHLRTGELLYEWNDLAGARDHLASGLERAELGGDARTLIAGCVVQARVNLTDGEIASATDYLERARALVEQASFPDWTSRFERCQLELWLAQNRRADAVSWARAALLGDAHEGRPDSEPARLAIARVLIVYGDAPSRERAMTMLDHLIHAADGDGRAGILIEGLSLRAIGHWKRGDRAVAMLSLERALRLAEPQGYVRLFADLGLPMTRLLQEARTRTVMPEYVARLISACGGDLASPAATYRAAPEPLSRREQEVLRLVAAGLTNREIADQLIISSETVKKHTGAIYGKLAVGNRTEAAARARDLDLL